MEVRLVININGVKDISLTEEQARELQTKLNSTLFNLILESEHGR